MRPSALFMDCYGTLLEGDRGVIEAVTHAAARRAGVDQQLLDRAWWQRFRALCAQRTGDAFGAQRDLELEAMADVLRDLGDDVSSGELVDLLEPLFCYWRTAAPFADAIALLRRWTICPVVIVSNIDSADLHQVLPSLPRVAGVVTSQDARAYKPDAAVFRHALAMTGLSPDRVVHVGDSWESDVLGAAGAGITPVWLDRGGAVPSERDRMAVARISALSQLEECVESLSE